MLKMTGKTSNLKAVGGKRPRSDDDVSHGTAQNKRFQRKILVVSSVNCTTTLNDNMLFFSMFRLSHNKPPSENKYESKQVDWSKLGMKHAFVNSVCNAFCNKNLPQLHEAITKIEVLFLQEGYGRNRQRNRTKSLFDRFFLPFYSVAPLHALFVTAGLGV